MPRNVPVCLASPDAQVYNADLWTELGRMAGANPEFTPLELKTFYVVGLIDDICQSVQWLLSAGDAWPNKYLPAFGVFASAIDILGRCLTGNETPSSNQNLRVGFCYIASPTYEPPPKMIPQCELERTIIVRTNHASYTVGTLEFLRHYAAHGQATVRRTMLPHVDMELLGLFPKLLGDAMETYWTGLTTRGELCTRIGKARIDPYSNRAEPLRNILAYFQQPQQPSMGSLFYRLDWRICPGHGPQTKQ